MCIRDRVCHLSGMQFNNRTNGTSALIALVVGLVLMSQGTFVTGASPAVPAKDGVEAVAAVNGWVVDFF